MAFEARSAAPRLLQQPFITLSLVRVYTASRDEVSAWNLRDGSTCLDVAHAIHIEVARRFLAAEVFYFDDLKELGSEESVRRQGKLRQQGKGYVMEDGMIFFVKFQLTRDDIPRKHG